MKKYVPTNFDLVDYDRELLKKQLDLETVEVTLKRDAERETEPENPEGAPFYVRSVIRFQNEDGMFLRLKQDLNRIAQEFSVEEEHLNTIFMQVGCSKSKLVEVLKGQKFSQWNELDDMALKLGSDTPYYKLLLETKGVEEIARRKKFLGLWFYLTICLLP